MNDMTIAIIKATIPVLRKHGVAITSRMYERMFTAHPEVERMFNPSHMHPGGQASTLAASILAYAEYIETPEVLRAALERIAHRHVAVQVRADQYAIVGEHLIGAIGDVLGQAAKPEIIAAWTEAYGVLAEVLIGREREIYAAQADGLGGWAGFRRFRVVSLRDEGLRTRSLELTPVDGGAVPRFEPGSHVSVRVPGHEHLALRPYSLSNRPGHPHLRLTVQREGAVNGCPAGVVSGLVHGLGVGDELELTPPCGEFTLSLAESGPVVLIAGGVGITPLASMFTVLVEDQSEREVVLIHAVRSLAARPLADELDRLAQTRPGVRLVVVPEDVEGRLDRERLATLVPDGATCLFCGPNEFMAAVDGWLAELGVDASRRHYECFGPRDATSPSVSSAAA